MIAELYITIPAQYFSFVYIFLLYINLTNWFPIIIHIHPTYNRSIFHRKRFAIARGDIVAFERAVPSKGNKTHSLVCQIVFAATWLAGLVGESAFNRI